MDPIILMAVAAAGIITGVLLHKLWLWDTGGPESRPDDIERAQQPVKNRVEVTVREANDFPKPPSNGDGIENLHISFPDDGSTINISGVYHGKFINFHERHGRWHFGYGDTPSEATHRKVIGGDIRDRLDQHRAVVLTKRLTQAYLKDSSG